MSLLAYVSGHGFGHWTRSEPVLSRLAARAPVHVRTGGRALPLARRAAWAASVSEVDVGPGVAQRGPLEVDLETTRRELAAHLAAWPALIASEVEAGRRLGARLVYADVPPLAFEVAAALGVPAIGLANFTWSWIYGAWGGRDPFFARAAERLARAEGLAADAIRLPGGGGLETLGGPPSPELAIRRPPTCSREEARARLPRPRPGDERPVVLLSFGGYGDALDLSGHARAHPDLAFVAFAPPRGPAPENLVVLPHDHGLDHQDLVLAADALLAKPGYGTVSECLERPTPMVYAIPEGEFVEHPRLAAMIERWLPCRALAREDLLAGRWGPALREAMVARPREAPPPNGIGEAVARLDSWLTRAGE